MVELLKNIVQLIPSIAITVWIEYRFACGTLGTKIPKPIIFFIMLIVYSLCSWLNVTFRIAGTISGNTFYYGVVTFLLYLILFQGKVVKKLFITVFIAYGIPITFYIFLPFASFFFGDNHEGFLAALNVLGYVNILLSIVIMECVRRKLQNLRRELPTGYTIYLAAVLWFVQVAVCSAYDGMLVRNAGEISLLNALGASAFATVGIGIVIIAIFAVDRQVHVSLKEQLYKLQEEHFRSREVEWRRLSGFRHDIKNHLLCLGHLLENGKTRQAVTYMENLTDTVKEFDSPVETGNDYADALLSVKYTQARERDIRISLDMTIPAQGYIEPMDLCCILSNAFDNAIAACMHLAEEERWIMARAFVKQGHFIIEIKNSKPSYVTVTDGQVSPKEITANHGIGLDTVKTVVEQYGGTLRLSADEGFSFSVLLPPNRL